MASKQPPQDQLHTLLCTSAPLFCFLNPRRANLVYHYPPWKAELRVGAPDRLPASINLATIGPV